MFLKLELSVEDAAPWNPIVQSAFNVAIESKIIIFFVHTEIGSDANRIFLDMIVESR